MDLGLTGRRVVVTGASSGIGRATTLALAREGAELLLAARREEALAETAARAAEAGAAATGVAAVDLATAAGCQALGRAALARWSGRVDGLVVCVGATPLGTFAELSDEAWERAFTTKFLATVRLVRALLPGLRAADGDGGRVVVVAGNVALGPDPLLTTSGAINAALNNLVGSLGRELAPEGVGVTAVHPGPTRTDRYAALVAAAAGRHGGDATAGERAVLAATPRGVPAEAEEVAAAVTYLVSPAARHVTGTSLTMDGGRTWAS
ncbi:SDR family NAD(P)-dependent oxidoreductase [Streptomyces sp. 4N509B]|uniref:SDR family NAD(P)-dependent oxidoreductase n=1 Tax=Streptomyces sp. 4N509B TaxID=3457413 RepID=UPI003FD2E1F1